MKKLAVFLLCAAMCLSLVTVPAAAASSDSKTTSTAARAAAALSMMGAIQGDGSGSLGLSDTLTRAQFCKIAVVVLGLSDKVSQYAGYTIFPDVPSSAWAAGYVNLAVRSAGILTGYPNGSFGPNDLITYGQAVTILMKMLGYTASDVGAKWPDGFMTKANEIGLTSGVTLGASSSLTKGDMAVLFLNLLNTAMNGSGKIYMETIPGAAVQSGVFLVSSNAETDDGVTGAVQIAGAKSGTYLPAGSVPGTLVGTYGSLVLNNAGKALVFVPTSSGSTVTSTVTDATAGYIKCTDGTKIAMTSASAFYLNGTAAVYGSAWTDISNGMLVSAHYSDGGALQCVLVTSAGWGGSSVTVVTSESYKLPASATVTINGNPASSSDIEKYDVLSDNGSGIYSVTRRHITGTLEDSSLSTEGPDTVTLLGTTFNVLPSAADALGDFKIGDTITLLLTGGNEAAGIVPGTALYQENYGVVTNLTSTGVSVKLACGLTVSGGLGDINAGVYKGSLVKVVSGKTGLLNLYGVSTTTGNVSLNVADGTLGSAALSKALVVYESIGGGSATEISLSDIAAQTVDASKIKYAVYDAANRAYLLLLDDVTGDRYAYGMIGNGTKTVTADGNTATYDATSVTNGNGTTTAIGGSGLFYGEFAGIAASLDGKLAGTAKLTAAAGVARQDFQQRSDGSYYVTTDGGVIPVAAGVQAYIADSGIWTTLAKARTSSDHFTVYYDRTIDTGGKVRVVVAN